VVLSTLEVVPREVTPYVGSRVLVVLHTTNPQVSSMDSQMHVRASLSCNRDDLNIGL
jgi:hypothetical protein